MKLPARLRWVDTPVARALAMGIAVSVVVTVLSRLGGLAGWETRAVDLFLFFRERVASPDIVLVLIDEAAFEELGERQPLSRRYLAELAEFLLQNGAPVVGFDIHLTKASSPNEDAALIEMSRRWDRAPVGRVVFTTLAVPATGEPKPRYALTPPFSPDLRALVGYANAPSSADSVIRQMLPVLPGRDGGSLPSFALAVLAGYEGRTARDLTQTLAEQDAIVLPVGDPARGITRREPVTLKTLSDVVWRIDFVGPPGSFASFPSGALIEMIRRGVRPAADNPFTGKIVLVGATFEESRDFHPTPLGPMSGVEIQANMIHTLLSRRALLPPHWALNLSLLIGACAGMALLSVRLRPGWVTALSTGVIVVFVLLSYEAYSRGYWLDFVAPLMGMKLYRRGAMVLARRRLNVAFGQFVSREVMDRVMREGSRLGGEVRTVSVLMSDVRGFTTLSERLPPAEIWGTMNEYFPAMVEAILGHRGMVNDFLGDGILAIYGAPVDDPEHAWHAVETALEMQAALRRLNARWATQARAALGMGVAVNTGEAFVGTMGSPRRKKYTVLGDTVNTVARMEGLNRDLGTEILISAPTLAAVTGRVIVKDRGGVHVKGKAQPIELYELLGVSSAAGEPAEGRGR